MTLAATWPQNDHKKTSETILGYQIYNFLGCMLPHPPSWCLLTSIATGLLAPHTYVLGLVSLLISVEL